MRSPRRFAANFALALLLVPAWLSTSGRAWGQEQEGGVDPEQIKKKVVEIERLMKSAEEALARSTDTRSAQERAAEAARKMLDEKARQETGKSADDLRKEAEAGSKGASETLERLTKAANDEARKAAERMQKLLDQGSGSSSSAGAGVKEVIEKIRGEGQGASDGIKWLLEKAVRSGGGGGGGGQAPHEKKQPNAPEPKKPDKGEDEQPSDSAKRPESKTEPPKSPQVEQWLVELPPQVRKAYETQDWDSIPAKWRELLRQWTKKMADDLDKERR